MIRAHHIHSFVGRLSKFIGPGYIVAVGYLDPGNWATDLAAGSQFGYRLLFVIFISNLMAILLQSLCVRLGVITGFDLAQACTKHFSRPVSIVLYILCEIAIIATDMAELIGSAIALKLLFGVPMIWGVAITSLDVMIILIAWNSKGSKIFEFLTFCLVMGVAGCMFAVLGQSKPNMGDALLGFIPNGVIVEKNAIFSAISIIGATVMPHNLYLHSHLVQARALLEDTDSDNKSTNQLISYKNSQRTSRRAEIPQILLMTNLDSVIALMFALLVNSSILMVSAANFYAAGETEVSDISDAFYLLQDKLGGIYAIAFAVGLLLAAQSSSITGTMAGQIVMEGFMKFTIQPWARRLLSRSLSLFPALICIYIYGENGLNDLLVMSQVILSFQLPFAIWPLIYFTSTKSLMTVHFDKEGAVSNPEIERISSLTQL